MNDNQSQNERHFREKIPDVSSATLPQLFRQRGYFSARIGKIFHYGVPREIGDKEHARRRAFVGSQFDPRGVDKDEEHLLTNCTPQKLSTGTALAWHASAADALEHTDGKIATEAIRLLEENRHRPFFLQHPSPGRWPGAVAGKPAMRVHALLELRRSG